MMTEKDDDAHTSPANPDNRIELRRQAADAEHEGQIAQHPLTPPEGQQDQAPPQMQTRPASEGGLADAAAGADAAASGAAGAGAAGPAAAPRRTRPQSRRTAASRKLNREVASTGHSWDGIEEYDNPLPRWWLWTFYATIVWAVGYTIAYPAWPLITQATRGVLDYSYRADVQGQIDRFAAANAPIEARLTEVPLDQIASDPQLAGYANNAGGAVFRTWCAQCHGAGGGGARGYPSLVDNVWLWGGTLDDIHTTITHGIRSPTDADTRYSEMPKFGADKLLDKAQIVQVSNYVLSLSGRASDPAAAEAGAGVFAENCASCHGEDGKGDRAQGAPDLTDAIWLYGGDLAAVEKIVHDGPFGVMPAWSGRLSEAQIRAVTAYVHGLGGGE